MKRELQHYQDTLAWTRGALQLPHLVLLLWKFNPDGTAYINDKKHRITINRTKHKQRKLNKIIQKLTSANITLKTLQEIEQLSGIKAPKYPPSRKSMQSYIKQVSKPVTIEQISTKTGQKLLGLYTATDGKTTAAEKNLTNSTREFGGNSCSSRLKRREITRALNAVHVPSQQY